MHETKEKVKKICEMKTELENYIYTKVMSHDDNMNVMEAGQFIDMVKDLCEAEKDCWKACYYKKMAEGMEPMNPVMMHQDHQNESMGYDNWRYSSGRFAPTGHGHRSGYMPDEEVYDRLGKEYAPGFMDRMMRQGYSSSGRGGNPDGRNSTGNSGGRYGYDPMERGDERYGMAYNKWMKSRSGYTSSGSQHDKQEMDAHAKEHMADTVMTLKEMWKSSDPELRKKMKTDLSALMNEMN